MLTDYFVTAGILIGLFSVPAMLAIYAEGRFPSKPMVSLILSVIMVAIAWGKNPAVYSLTDLPNVVVRVIADILH